MWVSKNKQSKYTLLYAYTVNQQTLLLGYCIDGASNNNRIEFQILPHVLLSNGHMALAWGRLVFTPDLT